MITFGLWLLSNSKLLLQWMVTHWRIVLVALMALAIWHYKSAYEAKTQEFELFQANVVQMAKDYEKEQALKLSEANGKVNLAIADSKAQFDKFKLDRTKSTNDLKAQYENINDTLKRNYDYRLHLQASNDNSSQTSSDSSGLATSESECNAAAAQYSTLEQACRITTIDFNTCRSILDADTLMYGREYQISQ